MMFKTNQRISEDVREEKQVKKVLPYTVADIGGKDDLKVWKADQQRKQDEWETGRADRYAEAKSRAVGVMQGTRKVTEQNYKADRAFEQLEQPIKQSTETPKLVETEEKSILAKVGSWVIDKFLDTKFEPK